MTPLFGGKGEVASLRARHRDDQPLTPTATAMAVVTAPSLERRRTEDSSEASSSEDEKDGTRKEEKKKARRRFARRKSASGPSSPAPAFAESPPFRPREGLRVREPALAKER